MVVATELPDSVAKALQARADEESRTVSEVATEAIEEYLRSNRFPGISFVSRPGGGRKSRVTGGLDVWEYVFTADAYGGDVASTAEHLNQPPRSVRLALEYYRAYPEEIDTRLAEMAAYDDDPERYTPGVRIVQVDA
jgi:hypothetical protein